MKAYLSAWMAGLLMAASATAGPVHISTDSNRGSGFAFRNGSQCVVLTAGHVVQGATGAVRINGANAAVSVDAAQFRIPQGADIASVTLPVSEFVSCVEPYRAGSSAQLPTTGAQYRMTVREANGNERVLPLAYAGARAPILRFRPTAKRVNAQRGDSGSVIFLGDRAVAIAIEVDPVEGVVTAFPVDQAETLLGYNSMVARLPLLAALRERGRDKPEWNTLMIAGLQDHPRVELGRKSAPADQCIAVFDVKEVDVRTEANPKLRSWRDACSKNKPGLTDMLFCAGRGAEPPAYIATAGIIMDVMMQKGSGQVRVKPVQLQNRFATSMSDRRAFTEAYVRLALPVALDQAMADGGCR